MSLTQEQQDYLDDGYDRKKDDDMLKQAEEDEPEFNTGFITAIALFLEHKHFRIINTINCKSDSRLYGASDHLMEMEIPEFLDEKLRQRIMDAKVRVIENRLEDDFDKIFKISNDLFEEFENIMIEIDRLMFAPKVVVKIR